MQLSESFASAGIKEAVDADMVSVSGSVEGLGAGEQLRISPAAVHIADQGAADQVIHAIADPGAYLRFFALRQAELLEHDIQRSGQVRDAVHQRAVEIEKNRSNIFKHFQKLALASSTRRAAMVAR
jgi:hypothetical protein